MEVIEITKISDKLKEVLDKRLKAPKNLFVSKEEFLQRIKEKYEL